MRILSTVPLLSAAISLGQATTAHPAANATKPLCPLSTADNGQSLTVQGKVRSEPHDMGFDIPGCNETVLLTFAGRPDNDVNGDALRQDGELRRFQKYTGSFYKSAEKHIFEHPKYDDVEAELTGKLEIARVPEGATRDQSGLLRDPSGKVIGMSGWGHPTPYARYRLVILSVAHVTARMLPSPK